MREEQAEHSSLSQAMREEQAEHSPLSQAMREEISSCAYWKKQLINVQTSKTPSPRFIV